MCGFIIFIVLQYIIISSFTIFININEIVRENDGMLKTKLVEFCKYNFIIFYNIYMNFPLYKNILFLENIFAIKQKHDFVLKIQLNSITTFFISFILF